MSTALRPLGSLGVLRGIRDAQRVYFVCRGPMLSDGADDKISILDVIPGLP